MGNKYMAEEDYLAAARAVRGILETLQAKAPFRLGIDREELRSSLFANWERRDFAGVLERWSQETIILVEGPWVVTRKFMGGSSKETILLCRS